LPEVVDQRPVRASQQSREQVSETLLLVTGSCHEFGGRPRRFQGKIPGRKIYDPPFLGNLPAWRQIARSVGRCRPVARSEKMRTKSKLQRPIGTLSGQSPGLKKGHRQLRFQLSRRPTGCCPFGNQGGGKQMSEPSGQSPGLKKKAPGRRQTRPGRSCNSGLCRSRPSWSCPRPEQDC